MHNKSRCLQSFAGQRLSFYTEALLAVFPAIIDPMRQHAEMSAAEITQYNRSVGMSDP